MKLLLDENLSPRLAELLSDVYPETAHVHDLGLGAADDTAIWDYAKVQDFAIVTKDADFSERSVLEIDPPKVVWIRVGNCTTNEIEMLLRVHYEAVLQFVDRDPETCLVLARD